MSIILYIYLIAIIIAIIGIINNKSSKNTALNSYSIAVVARNEEQVLPNLIKSLEKIDYPKNRYEIILVDDGSQDQTYNLMKNAHTLNNLQVITIKEKKLPGKKSGLQAALDKATGEVFMLTDADCVVEPDWLNKTDLYFDDKTSLVVGYAPECHSYYTKINKEKNTSDNDILFVFNEFHRFINFVAAGIYCSTIGLNIPFSCSGRNLAIRRATLVEAGGYLSLHRYESGDDKQVLRLISSRAGDIKYNPHKTVVSCPDNANFNEQQKRRFGKMRMSSILHSLATVFFIAFFIFLPFYVIINRDWTYFCLFYSATLIVWLINLVKHKEKFYILDLIFIIIYPYFFIYYTVIGSIGNWKWKQS